MEVAIRGGVEGDEALSSAVYRRKQAEGALYGALRELGGVEGDIGEALVGSMIEEMYDVEELINSSILEARDWKHRGEEIGKRRGETKETAATLRELSLQFTALMRIGDVLKRSEMLETVEDIGGLEFTLRELDDAREFCFAGDAAIFKRAEQELAQRQEDTSLALRNHLVDAVVVTASAMEVRSCHSAVADTLSRVGILDDALEEIIHAVNNCPDVLWAIRKAEAFDSYEGGDAITLEWTRHRTYPYDFAGSVQLVGKAAEPGVASELVAVPDIANIGARVDMLYTALVDHVLGGRESEFAPKLASLLWQWLRDKLFLPTLVLGSDGRSSTAVVPASTLQKRAHATFYLSQWIPELLGITVDDPVFVDVGVVEKNVALELRSEVLLRTRRAVNDFVLDDEDHVLLAPIASPWRPKERRNAAWFPSCLVTRTAVLVMEVVQRACADASSLATEDGEEDLPLPAALLGASKEALEAYRGDVPILHQQALARSLKLRCLYHNDCLMLAHVFSNLRSTAKLLPSSMKLRSAGNEVLLEAVASECDHIRQSIKDSSVGDGSLAHYGAPRIQRRCDEDLMRAVAHTQEVSRVFTVMLPAGAAGNATAALCTELLSALTSSILALPEIAAAACDGLELFLAGAISNCERLATRDRLREADSDAANAYATAVKRTNAFKEILNIRMEDIVSNAKQGKYDQLLDRSEVEMLILAIFENLPLREQLLAELKDDTQEEDWGW